MVHPDIKFYLNPLPSRDSDMGLQLYNRNEITAAISKWQETPRNPHALFNICVTRLKHDLTDDIRILEFLAMTTITPINHECRFLLSLFYYYGDYVALSKQKARLLWYQVLRLSTSYELRVRIRHHLSLDFLRNGNLVGVLALWQGVEPELPIFMICPYRCSDIDCHHNMAKVLYHDQ